MREVELPDLGTRTFEELAEQLVADVGGVILVVNRRPELELDDVCDLLVCESLHF